VSAALKETVPAAFQVKLYDLEGNLTDDGQQKGDPFTLLRRPILLIR
jgi:hypothetical protein